MVEAKRIAELLRQTYDGKPWHGPSLKENLIGVSFETAYSKSPGSAHTISVIVDHTAFWMEVVNKRLDGKRVEPTPEQDWSSTAEISRDAWDKTLKRLKAAHEGLVERIQKLNIAQLESLVDGKKYDTYTMLHGVIDHNVYHSGQIAILRKSLTERA